MAVSSAVEAYVDAIMKHVSYETIDNGIAATVPEAFGVVGIGADCPGSAGNLHERLEEWVLICLANGRKLAVVNGIDVATESNRNPVSNHSEPRLRTGSTYFRNAEELDAALRGDRRKS